MANLLLAIDHCGSINQAAKQMGLSYKGAWQIIERANNLSPKVLITTATGGSHGGGTCLTNAGRALLELFNQLETEHQTFLRSLSARLENDFELSLLLKPLTIKTSATNQLFGTVTAIQLGAVYAEIFVTLKGGEQIVASLTTAELNSLDLKLDCDVLLIINMPEISVLRDDSDYRLSARNCLKGSVIRVQRDDVDSEIVIRLVGGDSLVATITQVSADDLDLTIGTSVMAAFKSNAVMLGVLP